MFTLFSQTVVQRLSAIRGVSISGLNSATVYGLSKSTSINTQKKEQRQYPAILTDQAWSIVNLLYLKRKHFSCGIQRVIPSAQDSAILPARATNRIPGFGSSWPLRELAMQSRKLSVQPKNTVAAISTWKTLWKKAHTQTTIKYKTLQALQWSRHCCFWFIVIYSNFIIKMVKNKNIELRKLI